MSLEILKKYNIRAKKSLGQNFLVNEDIVIEIANLVEIKWKNIVEVWPWYWALTEKLLEKKPKSLNLVELDRDMIEILEDRIGRGDLDIFWIDFKINNIDVLKYEPSASLSLIEQSYKYNLIANIPYYITSPILRHFLYDIDKIPENMLILMQKDVWDKILWLNKDKSSVISLIVSKKSYVSERIFVWKENFIPVPKVESSVLLFETHDLYDYINDDKFLEIIKKWFLAPRKKLIKNFENSWLKKDEILIIFSELWIDPWVRWEDLWIEKWCELVLKLQ